MRVAVTTLAFCVASLLALGLVMLYSSSMTQVGAHYLMMQLIWCVFGFGLCVTAASLDYQLFKKFAWPIFVLAVCCCSLLVLEPHIGAVRGSMARAAGSTSMASAFSRPNWAKSRSSSRWPGMATVFSAGCTRSNGALLFPSLIIAADARSDFRRTRPGHDHFAGRGRRRDVAAGRRAMEIHHPAGARDRGGLGCSICCTIRCA